MVKIKNPMKTRKFGAATFPMLILALGGSAMLLGDKAFLSGLAPPLDSLEHSDLRKTKKKTPAYMNEEYEKRRNRWWKHTKNMPVCSHVTAVCSLDGLLPRLRDSVAAGAKMRSSVMGIGGGPVSLIVLVLAAVGIWFSDRLNKLMSTRNTKETKETEVEGASSASRHRQPIKTHTSDVEDQASPLIVRKNSKEEKSSLYHPEQQYHPEQDCTKDCLESPSVPSALRRASENCMTYLSGTTFSWTNPVVTFKVFIALLLFIELNHLMAPEQTIMYTPEIIALQRAKPDPREYVPYMADYLTPSLSRDTAELWYQRLKAVRNLLIVSWMTYLVLPPKRIGGVCYVIGALAYCYLATIGLMYNLGHSMQGGILFILCSILAVPFLGCPKYGDRSARWLRRFLYIGVLIPIYTFSGVAKFRYKGFWPQWSGSWMTSAFTKRGMKRSVFPGLYQFIRESKVAMALFSWGNVVVEYILPLAMLLWIENPILQGVFHVSSILFHVTIFVLMGPNFIRYCLMHILAWDPLGGFGWRPRVRATSVVGNPNTEGAPALAPSTWLDRVRAGFTFYALFGWFYVQFISDIEHLAGKVDRMERRNPYFPIPELSMFAKPKYPNFTCALILVIGFLACYVLVMFTRWSLVRDSTSTDLSYWLPSYDRCKQSNQTKQSNQVMVISLGEEEIASAKKQGKKIVVIEEGSTLSKFGRV